MTFPAQAATLPWDFLKVTDQVVDENPPGIGPVSDHAFIDLNDDNCLDIIVSNHHYSKPSPIWLGTPDHKFKLLRNMPAAWLPIAGFHLGEVDHNGDGWPDLLGAGVPSHRKNWSGPRKLFANRKGLLGEVATDNELITEHFGGIPKAADFNNDGNFDLADLDNDSHLDIVNQGNYGTRFWRNHGDNLFRIGQDHHQSLERNGPHALR